MKTLSNSEELRQAYSDFDHKVSCRKLRWVAPIRKRAARSDIYDLWSTSIRFLPVTMGIVRPAPGFCPPPVIHAGKRDLRVPLPGRVTSRS